MTESPIDRRPDGSETLILALFGIVAAGIGGHWVAANLAALVGRRRTLGADLNDSATALLRLSDHLDNPRLAWSEPATSNLPGPILYWTSMVAVIAAMTGVGALWFRFRARRHEPVDRRTRVGVDAQPRLAKTRDLAPLLARHVEPGRLVVGHWNRRLVMTEAETYGSRRGVRGGVLLFGPSQSGKTTRLIESVNQWTGPAIISSVKTDLMHATIEQRSSVGEVKVFDPIGLSGRSASTWSPLHDARTLSGALNAAQILARASGDDGPADRFWRGQAEQLLAAMLWVAANAEGHSMRHVVRWVVEMDRPSDDDPGTLAPLVRLLTDDDDEMIAADARQVQGWLHGQWGTDPRTSSSIYTTARNAVWPWTDPGLAASADGCDITLDWLTSGDNTLYLSAPLGDEGRLGVVFSVLLQDLIGQAFVRANRTVATSNRRLLVVLDEAANTPLPKLPQWAATVTGAGIQIVTVWQSKAQLDQAFGRDADNVLTNHRTKLIFPSGLSDLATIDYVSALVGDEHVRGDLDEPNASRREDLRTARSPATAVRLLTPNVLRQMQIGDALLVHGQLPPAWLKA